MDKPHTGDRNLLAILLFMTTAAACPPATAGPSEVMTEATEVAAQPTEIIETDTPVIPSVIRRILTDPNRDYASARGPDDCNSEMVYDSTKDMLAKYVDNPTENSGILKDYIMSGAEQCNCTAAIVGKDFEILLDQLGTNISGAPCL